MSSRTPEIDIDQLEKIQPGEATILDVREPREFVAGRVPGAVLVPMSQLGSRLHEVEKDRPVYVICASGNRSAAMTDALIASGYDAYNVAGGTSAWVRSGRPVETGGPSAS